MRLLLVATIADTLRGFYLPLVRHFRQRGWCVDGLAQGISSCPDCRSAFDNVFEADWSRNPADTRNFLAAPGQVRKIVERREYDIVHVNTPVASFITRLALRQYANRAPAVIYTAHGFHFHEQGVWWKNAIYLNFERIAARWTDYLTLMNQEDIQMAITRKMLPPERIVYIPGVGIDLSVYGQRAVSFDQVSELRNTLGICPEQPVLLMVAEFIPRKRHCDALRAFEAVGHPTALLMFAGDGPLQEPSRQLARKLGIESRVLFLGARRDVPDLLAAASALILPSTQEGLPRSVMEAMAMEVPVIGSDIRGTRDLLGEGRGILFPPRDSRALAGAISKILDNPQEARSMAAFAKRGLKPFEMENVLRQHELLYERAAMLYKQRSIAGMDRAPAKVGG